MKIYTIIGGVNGCGKSSLTGSIKAERTDLGIIVDPDKITAELGGDEYEGGKVAVEKLERALADGVSFTQETTLSGGYARKLARRPRRPGITSGCTMWAWTACRRACSALKTGSARVDTISPGGTWKPVLPGGSPTW